MKKTIVVFSNPFGYGPTGNAIPILKSLSALKNTEIIFAGSGLCLEILPKEYRSHTLDERNEVEIEEYLLTKSNVYVIGIQNRFCIRVAKKLGIPCAFLDILAWFWKEIPQDHLIADEIFWIRFMGIENKPEYSKKISIISGIVESTMHNASTPNQSSLLIHIGGAKYPVINGIVKNYLRLLSYGLNALARDNRYDVIYFVSSVDSVEYINTLITPSDVLKIGVMTRDTYLSTLNSCKNFLTTAGVSSTLEALYARKPTSFLLPINLSQMALTDFFESKGFETHKQIWEKFVSLGDNIRNMTEKEGIVRIEQYSADIVSSPILLQKYIDDFKLLSNTVPDTSNLNDIITYMGNSGSEEMFAILKNKWSLT